MVDDDDDGEENETDSEQESAMLGRTSDTLLL